MSLGLKQLNISPHIIVIVMYLYLLYYYASLSMLYIVHCTVGVDKGSIIVMWNVLKQYIHGLICLLIYLFIYLFIYSLKFKKKFPLIYLLIY